MKKLLIVLLCLLLTVSAAACGGTGDESYASAESAASEASSLPEESSEPETASASMRYDALIARISEGNFYFELRGDLFGLEVTLAIAERNGVLSSREETLGEVSYTVVKEGKSYSFDLAEPVYFITEETETHPLLSVTVFVSEGTEELNGKTYDCVLRALKEDESQTLTYFFDGESLYAVRISMRMGESETNSLLTVTAFTEEIPDDMLFGIPENYTEYDPATEPDKPDFPSELPAFTAGTLIDASEENGAYSFTYAATTQADCDAYIELLKEAGFEQLDIGLEIEDIFTALKDGMVVAVYFMSGVTALSYAPFS